MLDVVSMFLRSAASRLVGALSPKDHSAIAPENLVYGFVTRGFEKAFIRACRRLRVTPLSDRLHGFNAKSCGGLVRSADDSLQWLKLSGVPRGTTNMRREREKSMPVLDGLRTPQVLATTTWRSRGVEWYAVAMTPVSSPTVRDFLDGGGSLAHDEDWLGRLRATLGQLASIPTTHRCLSEPYVAAAIRERFGAEAPTVATEWHTAHGDLSWANLTVPDLVLYDWETWGLAPRAYDAAYLMVQSIWNIDLMHRLEHEFRDEFATPSGCVGLLVACAEMLNYIEASGIDPAHARRVEAIARRGLERHAAARSVAPTEPGKQAAPTATRQPSTAAASGRPWDGRTAPG